MRTTILDRSGLPGLIDTHRDCHVGTLVKGGLVFKLDRRAAN